ncbi:valine--tRNA ligase [bacterium]|nr:valine--tRNA ligase [bacterium]
MKSLDKVYDPTQVENKWYNFWMENKLFHADAGSERPKYTIMIPPPNVTGMLTMGHILNNTIQDLLIRWKKMDGYETLWMPGTDHAGIATQNKVEASLREEGLSRDDLGREKLIERVWQWKEKFGGIILGQLRRLGAACDWERERFTMDPGLSEAVKEVFIRLYEKGLIYKGTRLINWCPRCHTALADEEAPNTDIQGNFWHIRYPIQDSDETITVHTTRPETMLGDTAVAVHPEDDRYRHLIGKTVMLPLMERPIPVVADEHADPEKGSGAVKITPAHDFDDFMVAERHALEHIQVMDENAVMNENAGPYGGLDRFEARTRILADLRELGLLAGEEPRITPIPHCYRCSTVVEPYLSDQWFVKMKPLAEPAIKAVREGRIRFYPKHWEDTYFHWMENIKDWCISRQIWWGHRIPVWTCPEGHVHVVREAPESCNECGRAPLVQDPDVLDTWFSSWLWPFSTLGWPGDTPDLKAFFPTDALTTGPDIIFFWVARMVMASFEFMGDVPFQDVYFNGMVRDLSGQKMSKSKGNSPDPLWLIEGADAETVAGFAEKNPSYRNGVPAYGADAVRLTMVFTTPLGGDIHFDHTLVEMGQKFCNKLWNASRFVLMNCDENMNVPDIRTMPPENLNIADAWILSRLQKTVRDVRQGFQQFRFNDAARAAYGFVWGEFCDWYLELVKPRLYDREQAGNRSMAQAVVLHVLEQILKMLHPVMPFITEEIWQALPVGSNDPPVKTIMTQSFPAFDPAFLNESAEADMLLLQHVIGAVRNIRGEMNVPQDKKAGVVIRGPREKTELITRHAIFIERLANVDDLKTGSGLERPAESAAGVIQDLEIFVPLAGLIDIAVERERIQKEMTRMEGLLKGISGKLSNANFTDKAPADVVAREKQKETDTRDKIEKLKKNLEALSD